MRHIERVDLVSHQIEPVTRMNGLGACWAGMVGTRKPQTNTRTIARRLRTNIRLHLSFIALSNSRAIREMKIPNTKSTAWITKGWYERFNRNANRFPMFLRASTLVRHSPFSLGLPHPAVQTWKYRT